MHPRLVAAWALLVATPLPVIWPHDLAPRPQRWPLLLDAMGAATRRRIAQACSQAAQGLRFTGDALAADSELVGQRLRRVLTGADPRQHMPPAPGGTLTLHQSAARPLTLQLPVLSGPSPPR